MSVRRGRRAAAVLVGAVLLLVPTGGASVAGSPYPPRPPAFTPGAPGIGDPYFPLDGNGGYDVRHYDLDLRYDPGSDLLTGRATLTAKATQGLSAFNLDLVGLDVRSVTVDGRPATWARDGGELTVTPARGIRDHRWFRVVVTYDGVPEPLEEGGGFLHTDDGAVVTGEPHVAATWFPANDHPVDAAAFTIAVEVPEGLTAVSNGVLRGQRTYGGWTTWTWDARDPMASYLAVLAVGRLDLTAYEADGIRYWDAIDPDLAKAGPRTGRQAAISGSASNAYQRLSRTISVPAEGATLSFWVDRDTEPLYDALVVEARPVGTDEWTTLPDTGGYATQETRWACPWWLEQHPFLLHYQTSAGEEEPCLPTGTTGAWWSATGSSSGYERWEVDLGAYAGGDAEVAISLVSDPVVAYSGLVVDDIEVSTGEGSTSFEDDGHTWDGWTVPGAPEGSAPNEVDWTVGTAQDVPDARGEIAAAALARQPVVIDFLEELFGRYPFRAAGGIVPDTPLLGFALEAQTRPIYAQYFFTDPISADSVVVHELAHQWAGDSLRLERWRDIWLNEGFASYAEWLWAEREGYATAQEIFDARAAIPADDPFWQLTIGDPGPDQLFYPQVYQRGAMTLHALRSEVGDETFFRILRTWTRTQRGDVVSTPELVALAERLSGRELDAFFATWLYTPTKPAGLPEVPPEPGPAADAAQAPSAPLATRGAGPASPAGSGRLTGDGLPTGKR
ncbi:M1 family metallopeptidase [Cellulomonas cellasea]|uniref:M1 family metallopeptidase n=1 Tax=Cellulomonas cellasea TaxID=43670 RepID=UPI001B7FF6D5|nr:M1 family metallopeptidase [Cellulomonas cellasea]